MNFKIRFQTEGREETEIEFSPGLWLLTLAERYLEAPQALSLHVEPITPEPEGTK